MFGYFWGQWVDSNFCIRLCPSEIHHSQESVIWVGTSSWIRPPDGWRSLKLRAPNHHFKCTVWKKNPFSQPKKSQQTAQESWDVLARKLRRSRGARCSGGTSPKPLRGGAVWRRDFTNQWVSLSSNGLHYQNMTNSTRSPRFFRWCMLLFIYFHKEIDTFYMGKPHYDIM